MIGDNFMNKPVIKNLILIGIPTIISAIGIVMTSESFSNLKDVFIFITIGLLIAFIVFVIYYAKIDKKEFDDYNLLLEKNNDLKNTINDLMSTITSIKNLLNTNNSIVTSFVSIIEPWTLSINKIANDIKNSGRANEKDWDYEKICTDICIGCKDMIKQFIQVSSDTDVSVGFIKYYSDNDNECIKMIAHSSPPTAKPDIFDVQELLSECNYQYARLIKTKTRSILALENNERIRQCFYRKHDNTDLSKYTQYIAIPILCSRNKNLGVLQVTTKYGCVIMDTEVDLKKFGETYITPFVELLILVEKIQKGIFIKPENSSFEK